MYAYSGISLNHNLLNENIVIYDTGDCFNKVTKSAEFQSNSDIFNTDTMSSNFDAMLDDL